VLGGDANRASQVIERVRDLAKHYPSQTIWLNLNVTAEEIISPTRREVRQNVIR
jgi:hypothetical protein